MISFLLVFAQVLAFEYLKATIHSQDVNSMTSRELWHPHLYLAHDSSGNHYELRNSMDYYDVSISFLQTSQTAPGVLNCQCRFVQEDLEQEQDQTQTGFLQVLSPQQLKKEEKPQKELPREISLQNTPVMAQTTQTKLKKPQMKKNVKIQKEISQDYPQNQFIQYTSKEMTVPQQSSFVQQKAQFAQPEMVQYQQPETVFYSQPERVQYEFVQYPQNQRVSYSQPQFVQYQPEPLQYQSEPLQYSQTEFVQYPQTQYIYRPQIVQRQPEYYSYQQPVLFQKNQQSFRVQPQIVQERAYPETYPQFIQEPVQYVVEQPQMVYVYPH